MGIIVFNFKWMLFNIFLALVAVILGWLTLRTKNKSLKYLFGISWLLFLPNTVYLFTDLINLINQWSRIHELARVVVVIEYAVLQVAGFVTFILALYPFEYFLKKSAWVKKNKATNVLIMIFNIVIAFGISLGRIERVNSWDVLLAPFNVVRASAHILLTPNYLLLTMLFAVFNIFLYFIFRMPVLRYLSFIDKGR